MKKPDIMDEALRRAVEKAAVVMADQGFPLPAAEIATTYINTTAASLASTATLSASNQSVGGYARALSLSPQRRSEIARNAAESRWGKLKKDEGHGQDENDEEKQI